MTREVRFIAMTLLLAGCHSPRHVTDPDPSDKIPAIRTASARHDTNAIPSLIKDLDNDDSAIRLYAIEGLRTFAAGDDFGYRYFDDETVRKPAVERWHKWYNNRKSWFPGRPL